MLDEFSLLRDEADAYVEHALVLRIYDDNPQAALIAYEIARSLYKELGDLEAQRETIMEMAATCSDLGDNASAHRYVRQILLLYDNIPPWKYQNVLTHLKNLSLKQGQLASALAELKQLLETYIPEEGRKQRRQHVSILREMADVAERIADISAARNYFAHAAFLSEHPDVDSTFAAWEWGQMEYRQGNKPEGYALCEYAVWLDQTGLEDAVLNENPEYRQFFISHRQDRIDSRKQSLGAMIIDDRLGESLAAGRGP
jgi:hypothetical protein